VKKKKKKNGHHDIYTMSLGCRDVYVTSLRWVYIIKVLL